MIHFINPAYILLTQDIFYQPRIHIINPGLYNIKPGLNIPTPGLYNIKPGLNIPTRELYNIRPGLNIPTPGLYIFTVCLQKSLDAKISNSKKFRYRSA
jgi:hypothetical protein